MMSICTVAADQQSPEPSTVPVAHLFVSQALLPVPASHGATKQTAHQKQGSMRPQVSEFTCSPVFSTGFQQHSTFTDLA